MAQSIKQQFNVYLTPELIRQLKYRALDDQLSLSDLVQHALEAFVKGDPNDGSSTITLR